MTRMDAKFCTERLGAETVGCLQKNDLETAD